MSRRVSVVGRQDLRKEIALVSRYYAIMGRATQFLAFDLQLVSSGVYFGAAGLLIFAAAVLAGRKVHRRLKLQWVAGIALVTLTLNWLLLAALNRKEAEPRTSPPAYPAPSATP
jgi:hypothetical protein